MPGPWSISYLEGLDSKLVQCPKCFVWAKVPKSYAMDSGVIHSCTAGFQISIEVNEKGEPVIQVREYNPLTENPPFQKAETRRISRAELSVKDGPLVIEEVRPGIMATKEPVKLMNQRSYPADLLGSHAPLPQDSPVQHPRVEEVVRICRKVLEDCESESCYGVRRCRACGVAHGVLVALGLEK